MSTEPGNRRSSPAHDAVITVCLAVCDMSPSGYGEIFEPSTLLRASLPQFYWSTSLLTDSGGGRHFLSNRPRPKRASNPWPAPAPSERT